MAARGLISAAFCAWLMLFTAGIARAQGITVLPVNINMAPGQVAATMRVRNQTGAATAFQFRAFVWTQPGGDDRLTATTDLLVSPPISTVPSGRGQVVRLLLRHPAHRREATYRILVDQIPPPAAPGTVRIALRLSIPVFAEPPTRVFPHLTWHVETGGGQAWLVAVNSGRRHDAVRDIRLTTATGTALRAQRNVSPYVLAGVTRRWRIALRGRRLTPGTALHLTARDDRGKVDQQVRVASAR